MSLNVPKMKRSKRIQKLKTLLPKGRTIEEIAGECGVDEKTIDRDLKAWMNKGGFEDWLNKEFFRLHRKAEEEDVLEAYKAVVRLKERYITQKIQQDIKGSFDHKIIQIKMWGHGEKTPDAKPKPSQSAVPDVPAPQ